jgi:hypothetical protein
MSTQSKPLDGKKQYWLDLVGFMAAGTMIVKPLEELRREGNNLSQAQLHLMAEVLIPYHAPDGKKYGFTVYILNKPNYVPAFEEMHALLEMAPQLVKEFGELCQEVAV